MGESARMRAVYRQVEKLASSDIRTFIQGENAVILAEDELIDLEHFPTLGLGSPMPPVSPRASPPAGLTLFELERRYIAETLGRMGGNRTQTAKALGISLRGLQYRLRAYGTNGYHASEGEGSTGRHASPTS